MRCKYSKILNGRKNGGNRTAQQNGQAPIDLRCTRLDDRKQQVVSWQLSENFVLDVGEDDSMIGIEILDASKHLNLERLLPVKYEILSEAA